jgi:hypothetical protein
MDIQRIAYENQITSSSGAVRVLRPIIGNGYVPHCFSFTLVDATSPSRSTANATGTSLLRKHSSGLFTAPVFSVSFPGVGQSRTVVHQWKWMASVVENS